MPGVDGAGVARLPSASTRTPSPLAAHGSLWHALRDAAAREARRARSPSSQPARAAFEEATPAAGVAASLSITALLHESSALAALLREGGVTQGDRVALVLPNAAIYAVALHAVAAVGAVAVNCDGRLAPAELGERLDDAGVVAVVADDRHVRAIDAALGDSGDDVMALWAPAAPSGTTGSRDGTPKNSSSSPSPPPRVSSRRVRSSKRLVFDTDAYELVERSDSGSPDAAGTSSSPRSTWTPPEPANSLAARKFQMMFTSGTTGRPKGVLHTQAQVASNAARAADASALVDSDVWLHAAPMFHAMDAFATYAMVLVGGSQVAVGRRADAFDPREVARVIADRRVTVTAFAAAQLAAVLEVTASSSTFASSSPLSLASLRLVSAGGSDVSPRLVREFLAARPDTSFFTDYGMTEMGGACAPVFSAPSRRPSRGARPWRTGPNSWRARVASPPTDDAAVEVLVARRTDAPDDDDESTPDEDTSATTSTDASTDPPLVSVAHDGEEIGEVVVRGSALFDGYWDPSTRTSTPPKLSAGGWFRTGDAATVDAHGWLRVVDRIKDVIIVGGENVFCGEVERALESHPAIERAAAYGVPDALLGETVEAAATLAPDRAGVAERDIVAHCASMLAPFKVPRRVVILVDMPTTATGKIRRNALRAAVRGGIKDGGGIDGGGGIDAVDSSSSSSLGTERRRDRLGREPRSAALDRLSVVALVRSELASLVPALASVDDDAPLAHAGLHSVAAVELSRRLNVALADAVSETLPSLLAFDRPTVRAIADYVARDERGVLALDGSHHRRVAHPSSFAASSSFSAAARLSGRSGALPGGFAFGGSSDDLVLAVETQTATPRDRWDLEATGGLLVASDRDRADPSEMASIVTRHASYLAEDAFACDPEIVGAGVAELAAMDPSHRLVVLHAAAASVDARLDAKLDAKLDGAFTSVYVGCMWGGEWSDHLATNAGVSDAPSAAASTGSGLSFMAGRVAFTLDFRGACAAIDTACSSSLVATHMARESLVSAGGTHDAAVAAGVSVSLRAETTTSIAALGALSSEGRCKTFDASADGYGRGEGCVAFFVETFDARDDGIRHDGDDHDEALRDAFLRRRRDRARGVDDEPGRSIRVSHRAERRVATRARARRDPRARERSRR